MKIQGKTAAEIVESVRSQVHRQQLPADTLLPPVRDLAAQLGVNRNTVAAAYRRLVTMGVAVAQGRLGTRIRSQQQQLAQEGAVPNTPLTDLASGNPAAACLPDIQSVFSALAYTPRLYGEPVLNAGLQHYLQHWFASDCLPDFELNLSHGAVDACERLLSAYLVAGDKVAVEDPCFLSSINALHSLGLEALGLTMDDAGVVPSSLQEALEQGVQAVILTPRAHNPTGSSFTAERAAQLEQLLAKYPHVLLILDDHFALLARHTYYSVLGQRKGPWALVRSFSKAFGPDVRVAAVASDTETSQRLRLRLTAGTNWVSHILQDIVQHLLLSPDTQRLLSRTKQHYHVQRERLEHALRQTGIEAYWGGDGLNMWIPLPCDDQVIAQSLADKGWLVRPGSVFLLARQQAGIRVTFTAMSVEQMDRFAHDLQLSLLDYAQA